FIPIFLPVVTELDLQVAGYPIGSPAGLVWFCTLVAVNLQTAFLSPPVAMAAYYLKGVAPEWDLGMIYRGMMEFMILQCIGLAIVLFFPQVALWLPSLLMK
ncbi:MAG: TRAP transporter large permease subunit, partial [Desulfobacteraceae bacterium]|nr:TRAP transporter large permease subunit [Desulfobacteraceae bacterium]